MKIAMIGQKGAPATWGGVEKHVENICSRLSDMGHEVLVYTRKHYVVPEAVVSFQKKHQNVRLISRPSVSSKHLDTITHTLFAIVHAMREQVDVYHFHSVGPSLLSWIPRIFCLNARVVTTFHSPDRLHQKWGVFARFMLTLGERTALKFAHRTVVVSRDLQSYTLSQYRKKPVYVPNGVHIPQRRKASLITAQFGLQEKDYLLVVVRLVPHKGVHHLIQAFKKLQTTKKLVIVGDSAYTDDYVKQLHMLAADDPRILFTGYQTGRVLEELFSCCYLYVQPSESEGLAISILEASSYGKCVLSSDIPSNAEIVSGRGHLFKNADVEDLRAQLADLLRKPQEVEEAGKQLLQLMHEEYDWDHITQKLHTLYHGMFTGDTVEITPEEERSYRQAL